MAIPNSIIKQPFEEYTITADFSTQIPGGETLASATVSATNIETSVVDNTVITSTTATIASPNASIGVLGGTTNTNYKIEFRGTTNTNKKFEKDILMYVRNL